MGRATRSRALVLGVLATLAPSAAIRGTPPPPPPPPAVTSGTGSGVERGEWDQAFLAAVPECASLATAFHAAFGEVKVTRVEGKSRIEVGQSQAIAPGAFRLDQFSPERKAFGCDITLAFHANRLEGAVRGNTATLDRVVEGKLTGAELVHKGDDLAVKIVGTAEPGARITREGSMHAIPLGFPRGEDFQRFGAVLASHLGPVLAKVRKDGRPPLEGVAVFVIGSSVKGRSAGDPKKGKPAGVPFDGKAEPSDMDVTIVSPDLFEEGKRLGCNVKNAGTDASGHPIFRLSENCEELEGRTRPAAGAAGGHPELTAMREKLTALLASGVPEKFKGQDRPMNYVVSTGRPARAASIDVPPGGTR